MANFDVKNYEFVFTKHHQKNIIGIKFPYNQQLLAELQSKVNCRWSHSLRMWYCADDYSNRESLHLPQKSMSDKFLIDIHPNNHHAFRLFAEQLILKGYSKNTQKTYLNEFAQFLKILNAVEASKLTKEQLRSYFLYCHQQLKLSFATIHSRMNAVKFYYEQILQQTIHKFEIPRPKKPSRLPKTLTKIDILKMLDLTQNLKHKLLLKLCYGMGLRVSELINLKVEDINSETMLVRIEHGKGGKDRYVNLPESIVEELREYYKIYRPKKYLFEGAKGGQYTVRSAQLVFKNAMKKANINKSIGIHGLRHSYATHLLEYGTDIRLIKELLGHKDIKTTMIYTAVYDSQLAKVKSPLDRL